MEKTAPVVDDSDSEDEPDVTIKVPAHKVKLIIGAGGEKIKWIQRKSKARVQVCSSGVLLHPAQPSDYCPYMCAKFCHAMADCARQLMHARKLPPAVVEPK